MTARNYQAQNALPPRDFDIMTILDPIIMTALAMIPVVGPYASYGYGMIKGGVEDGREAWSRRALRRRRKQLRLEHIRRH
jgi:hypothetical protein